MIICLWDRAGESVFLMMQQSRVVTPWLRPLCQKGHSTFFLLLFTAFPLHQDPLPLSTSTSGSLRSSISCKRTSSFLWHWLFFFFSNILSSSLPTDDQFLLRRKADAQHSGSPFRRMQDLPPASPRPQHLVQFSQHAECPLPPRWSHRVWAPAPFHPQAPGPHGERRAGAGQSGRRLHQTAVPEQSLLDGAGGRGAALQPHALQTGEGRCCEDLWHRKVSPRCVCVFS